MSLNLDERPVVGCLATPFIMLLIILVGLYEVIEEFVFGPYRLEDYETYRSYTTLDDDEDDSTG